MVKGVRLEVLVGRAFHQKGFCSEKIVMLTGSPISEANMQLLKDLSSKVG